MRGADHCGVAPNHTTAGPNGWRPARPTDYLAHYAGVLPPLRLPSFAPPVRSMDRYTFSIRDGRLVLHELYAVGNVSGTGASATISKYPWSTPGTHVDGIEAWLYPIVPSQVTG